MNSWSPRLHLLCKVFAHNKALLSVTFTALQLLALKIAVREGFVSREVCVPWASSSKCQCHLTPSSLLLPIPSQGCCVGCPGVLCGVSGGAVWGNCELRINSCWSELRICPWYPLAAGGLQFVAHCRSWGELHPTRSQQKAFLNTSLCAYCHYFQFLTSVQDHHHQCFTCTEQVQHSSTARSERLRVLTGLSHSSSCI